MAEDFPCLDLITGSFRLDKFNLFLYTVNRTSVVWNDALGFT